MSGRSLFDELAAALEERTSFNSLEARGTLRLALRKAGLEPDKLTRAHTAALVRKILPEELRARGVPEADEVCEALAAGIENSRHGVAEAHRPETLFERLRGDVP